MPTGERVDPYAAFSFVVEIAGIPSAVAGFSEISGVNTENPKIEYREGRDSPTVRKQPGLINPGAITFKKGLTHDMSLWNWRNTVLKGQTERRSGAIVLRNEAGEAAMRFAFTEAWPSKIEAPAFNAKSNEIAILTMVIEVESLTMEPV